MYQVCASLHAILWPKHPFEGFLKAKPKILSSRHLKCYKKRTLNRAGIGGYFRHFRPNWKVFHHGTRMNHSQWRVVDEFESQPGGEKRGEKSIELFCP